MFDAVRSCAPLLFQSMRGGGGEVGEGAIEGILGVGVPSRPSNPDPV